MFASASLARRIDGAEARLSTDVATVIARRRPGLDVMVAQIGTGMAVFAGPDSPVNKMIGVGFDGPLDDVALEIVEREMARRHAPVRAEVSTLADLALLTQLVGRGYALSGFENVLGRALDAVAGAPPPAPAGVEVEPVDSAATGRWIETVTAGFAHPDAPAGAGAPESSARDELERVFEDMAAAPGFRRYFARVGGEVAGGASLRLSDGIALLCGASTLPRFRRQGVQTALLATRLADAARQGCELAVVTTQPGSKSQENVQRQGFALLYTRAVLIKPAPAVKP